LGRWKTCKAAETWQWPVVGIEGLATQGITHDKDINGQQHYVKLFWWDCCFFNGIKLSLIGQ